jgi:predicted enzyme related to lactoylglutathione lyase
MIRGINAILIYTNQFENMVNFYKNVIGVPLSIANHGGGKHAEIDYDNIHFSIIQSDYISHEKRGISVSFHVEDVQSEYERILKYKVDVQKPQALPFGGIISTLKDPDGNGVILMMWQSEEMV